MVHLEMLGNSIVPQCAMHAWNNLAAAHNDGIAVTTGSQRPSSTRVAITPVCESPPCNLVLTDGERRVSKAVWATPTHSVWHAYRSLTDRSLTVFSNQLFYEVGTQLEEGGTVDKRTLSGDYIANPVFVEILMGYPKDWTRV